jgi:hypothetical protein
MPRAGVLKLPPGVREIFRRFIGALGNEASVGAAEFMQEATR